MMANGRSIPMLAVGAAGIAAVDQLVKTVVSRQIGPASGRNERWLFGDWFGLSYAENSGVAFGLMRDRSTLLLVAGSVAIVVVLTLYLSTHRSPALMWVAGAMIAGGAAGNMIDRVRLGYVRDFFAVGPWPRFNVADAAITIGVVIAFLSALREDRSMERHRVSDITQLIDNRALLTDVSE